MIDLAVAYRIYPGVSKTPALHSHDKYLLSQMCLRSFAESLGALRTKVWAILDGCPPEYESLFRKTLGNCELEIVATDKVGNLSTFAKQIDILASQADADYVYFAEDDYFYLPGALEKMIDFLRENSDADFITPYDHPDSYTRPSCIERHVVRPDGQRYWRTATSTCLTFLTTKARLAETQNAFRTYSRGNGDYPMWQMLTQRLGLFDPRIHFVDSFRLKSWLRIWRWGLGTLLTHRSYSLWAPIPTLATHMESTGLSPVIDWLTVFQDFELQLADSGVTLTSESSRE
jgi:hypothetical protein